MDHAEQPREYGRCFNDLPKKDLSYFVTVLQERHTVTNKSHQRKKFFSATLRSALLSKQLLGRKHRRWSTMLYFPWLQSSWQRQLGIPMLMKESGTGRLEGYTSSLLLPYPSASLWRRREPESCNFISGLLNTTVGYQWIWTHEYLLKKCSRGNNCMSM